MLDTTLENTSLNSQYWQGSFCSISSLSISLLSPLSQLQARASLSLIIWLILYKLVIKAMVLGRFKFQQSPMAPMQQISTNGRFVGFFTVVPWTVFCGRGFTTLFSSCSIFYKLFFQSIYLVQRPIFLAVLCSCIGPKPASLLLTSWVSSAGSAISVVWGRRNIRTRCKSSQGRRSIRTHCELSCISFLKAWSLRIALAR